MRLHLPPDQDSNKSQLLDKVFATQDWCQTNLPSLKRHLRAHECEFVDEVGEEDLATCVAYIRAARKFGYSEYEIIEMATIPLPSAPMVRLMIDWLDVGKMNTEAYFG